jgi:hypothetical protein
VSRWLAVALMAFGVSASSASAATFSVTGTADGSGSCAGTTCTTLRAAVAAAGRQPGSTVKLGKGRFTLGQAAGGQLTVTASMTITGAGAAKTTIAQTDGVDRVVGVGAAAVTLQGLTITGGRLGAGASEPGAGIYTLGPLTLRGVTVSGNNETTSAAIPAGNCCQAVGGIASLSSLTLLGTKVVANSATGSPGAGSGIAGGGATGGIYATQFQPVTITNSVVSNNTATGGAGGSGGLAGGPGGGAYGGVLVIDGAPLTVTGSTFSGNRAQAGAGGTGFVGGSGGTSDGGAIFIPDGVLQISASTFERNVAAGGAGGTGTAGSGGAGANAYGGAVAGASRSAADNWIVNSTFFANRVSGGAGGAGRPPGASGVSAGGGLGEDTDAGLTLVSSTLDANVAQGAGQEFGGNLYDQFSPIALAQTLFAGGVASAGANCAIAAKETDDGHNLETTSPSQCGLSGSQHDLIGARPRLPAPAAHGGPAPTIALPRPGPGVGAGGTCLNFALSGNPRLQTDERGRRRPIPCDVGAFQTTKRRRHRHHHHHKRR